MEKDDMKYVALSFDDSRADTYWNACKMLKQYGLRSTINVTTDFLQHPENYDFPSAENKPMTVTQLLECQADGFEIASHGHRHINTPDDVLKSIQELKGFGIDTRSIGFASPSSEITRDNIISSGLMKLLEEQTLTYIRSGLQIRREGVLYTGLSVVDRFIHSDVFFQYLNKKTVMKNNTDRFMLSAAVFSYTTVEQIHSMIKKLSDEERLILMFHSILSSGDKGYGRDKYYWDVDRFECLLKKIVEMNNTRVVTTCELLQV